MISEKTVDISIRKLGQTFQIFVNEKFITTCWTFTKATDLTFLFQMSFQAVGIEAKILPGVMNADKVLKDLKHGS